MGMFRAAWAWLVRQLAEADKDHEDHWDDWQW